MQTAKHLLALSISSLLAFPAVSQQSNNTNEDNEIEVVEVYGAVSSFGATKSQTPIVEMARSLSIETAEAFNIKGALSLSQATTYTAGITGETFGFATRGDWVRSRGLAIPRYRDSIQELFGSYNTTRPELYTIEQVELLRGPASVLYGQGSPGGIVNYVSKTPRAERSGEIVARYGSFDNKQLGVDVTGALNDEQSVQGRFVGLYRDAGTQVDFVDDKTYVAMPSISFLPSDDTKITVIGMIQDTESDTASQFIPVVGTLQPLPDGSYLDQDVYIGEPDFNRYDTESTQLTVLGEHRFNDDTELTFTALWRDGEADYHQAWPTFTGNGVSRYLNDIAGAVIATPTTVPRSFYQADNESEQKAFDVRLRHIVETGAIEHEILAGAQYQDVVTDNNISYLYGGGALQGDFRFVLDLANPVYTGAPDQSVFDAIYVDNPEQNVKDLGFYISDNMTIGNWHLTAGVRYDDIDNDDGTTKQSDSQTSFSGGLLYAFESGVAPYISYAESFETVVGQTAEGDQLEPEEARQWEAGIKYEPGFIPGFFSAAYYDIEISNLPNPNALPATAGQQLGVSKLSGLEFEAKFQLEQVSMELAYSTIDAEDPNGFELSSVPESQGSIWLLWEPTDWVPNLRIGGGVRHVGQSVSEDGTVRYETPSYTLGDFMMGYDIDNNLSLALNVRNVTDKKYLTSCLARGDCFPGLRRTVTGTLTYRF